MQSLKCLVSILPVQSMASPLYKYEYKVAFNLERLSVVWRSVELWNFVRLSFKVCIGDVSHAAL